MADLGANEKVLVRESMSPCIVPTLLVSNKDRTQMCIDSRAINRVMIRYYFPVPRPDDLLDQLHSAAIFSTIDVQNGYQCIRM